MNTLQTFNFNNQSDIRTVLINDEPFFVGKDVAEALGYVNTRDALAKHVDSEDKNSVAIHDGNKGNPNQVCINESGIYSLVFGSKLPSAKAFKRWVTTEVLPAIRNTGSYSQPMSELQMISKLATHMDNQAKELAELKLANAQQSSLLDGLTKRLDNMKQADVVPKNMATVTKVLELSTYVIADKTLRSLLNSNVRSTSYNIETAYGIQSITHYCIADALALINQVAIECVPASKKATVMKTHPLVGHNFKLGNRI